jgi:hypothetical protein
MPNKKEVATKQPDLNDLINDIEDYRKKLFESKSVSSTGFNHMQTALHGVKNIIRAHFGAPIKGDIAWVK